MLDSHSHHEHAIVESIFGIPSYSFFVGAALLVGFITYLIICKIDEKKGITKKNTKFDNKHGLNIIIAVLGGGLIGAKIPVVIENYKIIFEDFSNFTSVLLYGKSIIGGLIGGFVGIRIYKKINKIEGIRLGNKIAPAAALGMAVGRIGCFLAGCCYGIEIYGFHLPTQLIEMVYCLGLFIYLIKKKYNKEDLKDGELFTDLLFYYFIFRFFIEFFRGTEKLYIFSIYQVICALGVFYIYKWRKKV